MLAVKKKDLNKRTDEIFLSVKTELEKHSIRK